MKNLAILFTPHWLAGHALALTLVVLFVNFGFWQLRRHDTRATYNALLESRFSAPPLPYSDLSADVSTEERQYRATVIRGRFDPENEILLRSRSFNEQPGYHVLTPLVFEDGRALLVDRGWVPYRLDTPPVAEATPPEGEVEVSGILFPEQEQPQYGARDPAEGRLRAAFWVNTTRLAPQMPYQLEPLFLQLTEQVPAGELTFPLRVPPPTLRAGSHMGYAFQWFSFALIGILGYPYLLVQQVKEERLKRKREGLPKAQPQRG